MICNANQLTGFYIRETLPWKRLDFPSRNVIYLLGFFLLLTKQPITYSKLARKYCETCSKLTIKTPERLQWHISGVFIVNLVNLSYILLCVSIVNIEQIIACNGESRAILTNHFGVWLPHEQCFFYWQVCASTLFVKKAIRFIQTWVHCHLW